MIQIHNGLQLIVKEMQSLKALKRNKQMGKENIKLVKRLWLTMEHLIHGKYEYMHLKNVCGPEVKHITSNERYPNGILSM